MNNAFRRVGYAAPFKLSRLSAAIIVMQGALVPTFVVAETTPASDSTTTEVITVIGNKLPQALKKTTTATTVLTDDQLNNGQATQLDELVTEAPNVVTAGLGAISIRGLTSSGAATGGYALLTGARSRVTTIVDGTAQEWSGYNFTPTHLWDVEQVEVLRGPQSTTQGTSAMGGALVMQTKDPVFVSETKVRAGVERYENNNYKGNLAVMNSGPLIDDELAYRVAIDGTRGDGWMNYAQANTELDDGPDVDFSKNINARGKLLWQPSSMPQLSAKLTLEHHSYDGEYLSWANDGDSYTTQTLTLDSDNGYNTRLQDSKVNLVAIDTDYDIQSGITNSLHLAYLDSDVGFSEYPGDTVVYIRKKTSTFENRLLFNQADASLTGVIGLFAAYKDSDIDYVDALFNTGRTVTSAIYGEGVYALTDKLNLIAGARIENENVKRTSGYVYDNSRIGQDFDKTYFLPKLAVTYDISDETTLNLSARKGYSPGGTAFTWDGNRDIYTYDSEQVTTYEIGSKSEFTNRATLYTSVFYNDYSDYQAFIDTTYIDNIDSAHTYGLEAEATGWLGDQTELRGSVGLLHSKIDDYQSYQGNQLPSAPKVNLATGLTHYIGNNWSMGVDVTYVGSAYSDLDNTADRKVDDYIKTDARVQYLYADFTVDFYINNLTNEDIVYYKSSDTAYVGQTRTMGLNVTYSL